MLMYTGWQIGYLLITEVVLASWIRSDKEITFALKYQCNGDQQRHPGC